MGRSEVSGGSWDKLIHSAMQQGEVSRLGAQPERNFGEELSDLMEAYEAACCGVGVLPLGKRLESTPQIFSIESETDRICFQTW